jgi:integral membrane sensor domain MASE1
LSLSFSSAAGLYENNKYKGQTDSEFKKLDNELLSQINELSQNSREINTGLNTISPVFSTVLSRQHWKNSKTKQTPRDQYNYNLIKDGLKHASSLMFIVIFISCNTFIGCHCYFTLQRFFSANASEIVYTK